MKVLKRVSIFLLSIVLMLSMIPMSSVSAYFDDEVTVSGDYTYEVWDGVATIVDYNTSVSGAIVIPSTIDGYPVTSIGEEAFAGCNISSVTIPDSIVSIQDYAFSGCTNLETITIGDSVTRMGSSVFYDTAYYNNENNWNNHVLYLEEYLLDSQYEISGDCRIKDGTRVIADEAFDSRWEITSVTIPNSVAYIGHDVFWGCRFSTITMGTGIVEIGISAFERYSGNAIKDVYITDLGAWCNINFYVEDSNPLWNGANLYLNGELVTDLIIPNTVTTINCYTFYGCKSISSISIPENVMSVGSSAFYNTAYYNDSENWVKDVLYIDHCLIAAKETLSGDYVIKEGTKVIAEGALAYCEDLTAVTIPEGVVTISDEAFSECHALTRVTIPDSVTEIGYSAFSYCYALASVTIPNSVTIIGSYAFEDCEKLQSVTLGNRLSSVGSGAFYGCSRLDEVYISDLSAWCSIDFEYYSATPLYYGGDLYLNGQLVTDLTLPDDITEIKDLAFWGTFSLKSVTIPDSVTSIGERAFYYCYNMTSLNIPKGVNNIRYGAFEMCDELTASVHKGTYGETYCKENDVNYSYIPCDSHTLVSEDVVATILKDGVKGRKVCTTCGVVVSNGTTIKKASNIKLTTTTYSYNGKTIKPSVAVKDSAGNTISKQYYTITYPKSSKNVGQYTVTIKLKGDYSGTKTLTYKINPPKTVVSKLTAGKKSLKVYVTKKASQVSGYQVQYSTSKKFTSAKTKILAGYKKTSIKLTGLKAKKTYYVRVRTYKTVSGKKYYSGWSTYKYKKIK